MRTAQVNGNGLQMAVADIYAFGGGAWQNPDAWSVSALFDHHFTPEFVGHIEGSVGGIDWNNTTPMSMVSNSTIWLIGGVLNYDPVKNLDFEFEVFYQEAPQRAAERLGLRLRRSRPSMATRTASRPASRSPVLGDRLAVYTFALSNPGAKAPGFLFAFSIAGICSRRR